MKRLHLIEIEDLEWCPRVVRNGVTDYLQFAMVAMKPYAAMIPVLAAALRTAGAQRITDLCSGAAGPWLWLQPSLAQMGLKVSVCLTDIHPNLEAFEHAKRVTNDGISFCPHPVDATAVPAELAGFRTMFTAFHHFYPQQALAVLADAVRQRQAIGVFEVTQRRFRALLATMLAPLTVLAVTPFIRPFRWSRLFWTYLVPVLPMVILFDGLISCLRTYDEQELRELTAQLDARDYRWQIGTVKAHITSFPVTYIIGLPTETVNDNAVLV